MKHYISIDKVSGNEASTMIKVPLFDGLKEAIIKAPDDKSDCWLMSSGYGDSDEYSRKEENFSWIDTVFLDCDNGKQDRFGNWIIPPNPNLMKEFEDDYKEYDYIIWESASSTVENPKFRVLMFLDERIAWKNEPVKSTKQAIIKLFAKYTDNQASWFFTPTKGKISTVKRHLGQPFPAKFISSLAESLEMSHKIEEMTNRLKAQKLKELGYSKKFNENGWRNLPSVKKCLEGLAEGERDNSLNSACYAMNKNGYRESIREFLDEVRLPREIKAKFYTKYR